MHRQIIYSAANLRIPESLLYNRDLISLVLRRLAEKSVYPRGVFPISYNKEKISKRFMSSIISFIFLYFLIFFLVAMLLSFTGLDFITSFSGAATAISNVGPGLGDMIGPSGNFGELSNFAKWILSFAMLLGRLEIFTLLVLFFPSFWRN